MHDSVPRCGSGPASLAHAVCVRLIRRKATGCDSGVLSPAVCERSRVIHFDFSVIHWRSGANLSCINFFKVRAVRKTSRFSKSGSQAIRRAEADASPVLRVLSHAKECSTARLASRACRTHRARRLVSLGARCFNMLVAHGLRSHCSCHLCDQHAAAGECLNNRQQERSWRAGHPIYVPVGHRSRVATPISPFEEHSTASASHAALFMGIRSGMIHRDL